MKRKRPNQHVTQERPDLLGVSVHWMSTGVIQETKDMGLEAASTCIHQLEDLPFGPPGIARSKGIHKICPIDQQQGAAYVHCLEGDDRVGRATHILSYTWSYTIGNIVSALNEFCKTHKLNPKRTYIWMDLFCVNQHRVVEAKKKGETGLMNFEETFPKLLADVGHMVSMMEPWNNPSYLTRIWCIFELYAAHDLAKNCETTVIMPVGARRALEEDLFGEQGDLDALYEALGRTKVEDAKATFPDDRTMILGMIERSIGCKALNAKINQLLREYFRRVIDEMIESRLKPQRGNSPSAATKESTALMIRVAGFLSRNGELDEAMKWYRECLQIGLAGTQAESLETAVCRFYMGQVLIEKQQYDEALSQHLSALNTREAVLGNMDIEVGSSLDAVGHALYRKGNFEGALSRCQEALAIFEKICDTNDCRIAATHVHVGMALELLHRFDESLQHYRQSLKIRRNILTPSHPDICYALNCEGSVLSKQGLHESAMVKHKEALHSYEKVLGRHPDTAYTLGCVGAVLAQQEKYSESLLILKKALEIHDSVLAEDSKLTAYCYQKIGLVYSKQGFYEKALSELRRALSIKEKLFGMHARPNSSACFDIGDVFLRLGRMKEALQSFERSFRLNVSFYGKKHPYTVEVEQKVSTILKSFASDR